MASLTLSDLFVYPIKSAAGIRVNQSSLTSRGLSFDRRYMLVMPDGHFMTQRRFPKVALIQPQILLDDHALLIKAPGMDFLKISLSIEIDHSGDLSKLEVDVWGDLISALSCGPTAGSWFTQFLETPCQLVYMPDTTQRPTDHGKFGPEEVVSFADAYPYLLSSDASLAGLNQKLSANNANPVSMNRFRPNLVVSGDISPHAEDEWKQLRIGEAIFKVAKPCSRCSIPNVDQETGDRTREPSRTLATYRAWDKGIWFGQNLLQESSAPDKLDVLTVGDSVEILA